MALISGQLTTFGVVNYEGDLYNITPTDTPILSAIGGLFGGDAIGTTVWSWQEHDLRAAAVNTAVEGAAAPTGTGRTRTNVTNVLQIIHETIDVSYTKQATSRQVQDIGSAHAGISSSGQGNPITDEFDWQMDQRLKEIARDVEYTVINGTFAEPATNASARATRGLLEAISTNSTNLAGASVDLDGGSSSDDVLAEAAHGLSDGDKIQFTQLDGGAGLTANTTYFVVNSDSATFQLAASAGGTAIDFTTDIVNTSNYETVADLASADVVQLMQDVWDNGGIREAETATIVANSWNKRALTDQFLSVGNAGFRQDNRNVGGVDLQTFDTDFGRLNIMLNRYIPANTVMVVSLEELQMKWLSQDKGTFYGEDLGNVGMSTRKQLVGEWGLQYGNELSHGQLTGLSTR